jgi:Raf kinase inhibitor-like YbhB/YbcL family protein
VLVLTAGLVGLAACNDDGRTLRPARPDQNATVSSLAAPTTTDGAFVIPTNPASTLPGDVIGTVPSIRLTAPWRDGAVIDPRYTCDGADIAPALSWTPGPVNTEEIAISVVDDDAPDFVHWVITGIGTEVSRLGEGEVPLGAVQGTNGAGGVGYTGPCPPAGSSHTYRFTVHFLDQQLDVGDGTDGADLLVAIDAATIAYAEVTGIYSRG